MFEISILCICRCVFISSTVLSTHLSGYIHNDNLHTSSVVRIKECFGFITGIGLIAITQKKLLLLYFQNSGMVEFLLNLLYCLHLIYGNCCDVLILSKISRICKFLFFSEDNNISRFKFVNVNLVNSLDLIVNNFFLLSTQRLLGLNLGISKLL
jgi:hypothetical protein